MKSILACFTIIICALSLSAAEHYQGETYISHVIHAENVKAVEVTLSANITIDGSCNHGGISGSSRIVELKEGWGELYKMYVLPVATMQTEIGCDGTKEEVVSTAFTFQAKKTNIVALNLLIPEKFKVSVKEIK